MKTYLRFYTWIVLLLISPGLNAQVGRDRLEKAENRIEIGTSKNQIRRDTRELEDFRNRIRDYKLAYLTGNMNELTQIRTSIVADMNRETEQSRSKANSGAREEKRSSKELKNSDKDLNKSTQDLTFRPGKDTNSIRALRDDRRKQKDDIKDLIDDRRDLESYVKRAKEQEKLCEKFMQWALLEDDPADIDNIPQVKILNRFAELMENDIEDTQNELAEDRKELMEDRRELREDRRERREDRRDKREE